MMVLVEHQDGDVFVVRNRAYKANNDEEYYLYYIPIGDSGGLVEVTSAAAKKYQKEHCGH